MAKYNVSMAVDLRFDVEVEADSFEEAFKKADLAGVNLNSFSDWVDNKPVNAEREDGAFADYGYHPYCDER